MKYLHIDNSIIRPKIRIIGLCALSAYELVLLIIMLVAANAVGFGTYIVDKGLVATISTPLLLVLFLLALIYEIRRFWGKSQNRWGRYALYTIAAVLIVGSMVWYAVHSPVSGNQILTPMRQYIDNLRAPLLAEISPAENTELEAWTEKTPRKTTAMWFTTKAILQMRSSALSRLCRPLQSLRRASPFKRTITAPSCIPAAQANVWCGCL